MRRTPPTPVSPRRRLGAASGLPPLCLLAIALLLSGCRGETGAGELEGYRVTISLAPTPPVVGSNLVVLSLADPSGTPVTGAEVTLEGTMSHAGMVPVRAPARAEGDGRYRITDFTFTMAGDWILLVHVTLDDGRSGTLERSTSVVGAPGS